MWKLELYGFKISKTNVMLWPKFIKKNYNDFIYQKKCFYNEKVHKQMLKNIMRMICEIYRGIVDIIDNNISSSAGNVSSGSNN